MAATAVTPLMLGAPSVVSSAISPPATPLAARHDRPQSMYSAVTMPSPEVLPKARPQSAYMRPARSRSRLSITSSRGDTRLSDEEQKTAVKVVVRVRPALRASDPGFELIPQRFQRSTLQVPTPTSLSVEASQGRRLFIFDRVFGEETTQKGIWDYLEDSVDSFLQGYNVSILAYGQSGAGKSYTMGTSGPTEQIDPSSKGIVPRAVQHLFANLEANASPSRQNSALRTPTKYSISGMNGILSQQKSMETRPWQMTVTYVEIYNEQPRDLLLPEGTSVQERASVQIREDSKGRIFVEGLRQVVVNSVEELLAILNHGSSIRQTDATAINSRSSRSHAVFTIGLKQIREPGQATISPPKVRPTTSTVTSDTNETITIESKLHFVDLAGSERLKNTGATGERAREGISINAGLASLGKVISQLSSRSAGGHVSYRDSKLTRMLQDSLGGNAITYMVACVTPAEFHLSETLNTVQYAQRARNIQSRPKIQQIDEDGDKVAVINRLRTEVAFLRQQIRSSENQEGKATDSNRERKTPNNNIDMQNQLLDVQESYKKLSERHAKLVSEISMNVSVADDASTETAAEKMKRAQDNQQQIESIILEYEKTIQSLDINLSTVREALSTTESTLLEKETKCAYIETMNQQLNSRVQKLMDREESTETYLHDLESKLEDSSSGSEKHDQIVAELRKEMARIRENETNAEDYICTLEERLAEADQDLEIMQRENERLEQLVERQRSLGKLDNLLYQLDKSQRSPEVVDGSSGGAAASARPLLVPIVNGSHLRRKSEPMDVIAEAREAETTHSPGRQIHELSAAGEVQPLVKQDNIQTTTLSYNKGVFSEVEPSPAQTKFMQDKFESVSQELFDLKLEHETAVNDFDLLEAKYAEALRTLAQMQDHLDEVKHSPKHRNPARDSVYQSLVSESKYDDVSEVNRDEVALPSRSLSAELSMLEDGTTLANTAGSVHTAKETPLSEESSQSQIERLQGLLSDREKNMDDMKQQYEQLEQEHKESMDQVEKLRLEAQRSRSPLPGSPVVGMMRRPTSTNLGGVVDKGARSIVALRTMLNEQFEDKPDYYESADVHLSAAAHEMQMRFNRIQALENELQNMKREMEQKSAIISGLTRERNSLKSGTTDLSMVSQMRDQLIQKETELKNLHEKYAKREEELQAEIIAVRSELETMSTQHEKMVKDFGEQDSKIEKTAAELEAALLSIETLKSQQKSEVEKLRATRKDIDMPTTGNDDVSARSNAVAAIQEERDKYQKLVDQLKKEAEVQKENLERQISTNNSHSEKIAELTQMHEAASIDIHEHSQIIQEKSQEIEQHKVKIAALQNKLQEAESSVEFHKHGLKSLHETHANEIEELKLSHAAQLAGYDDQVAEMNIKHGKAMGVHETEMESNKSALQKVLNDCRTVLGHDTSADMLSNHIQDLVEERKQIGETNRRLVATNQELDAQLAGRQNLQELEASIEAANVKIVNYQETIKNLANEVGDHQEAVRAKEQAVKKHEDRIAILEADNKKKNIMIEELELQLQSSYEQNQNRVSVLHSNGSVALRDAQERIKALELEVKRYSISDNEEASRNVNLKSRPQSPPLDPAQRSNSISSNLRKSASVASLPTPPPAVPLPPLPSMPNLAQVAANNANPSPPASRHASKDDPGSLQLAPTSPVATPKDITLMKHQSAIIDEQDVRLKTIEKHLHAEKQLTATLEEALVDLETQSNKLRADAESWKKKAWQLEEEIQQTTKEKAGQEETEKQRQRASVQVIEEEVKRRKQAEDARAQLEERMKLLKQSMDANKKKKRGALNCF